MKLQKSPLSVAFVKVFAFDRKKVNLLFFFLGNRFSSHTLNIYKKIWQNFFSTSSSCHYPIPVRKVQHDKLWQTDQTLLTPMCTLQCVHCNVHNYNVQIVILLHFAHCRIICSLEDNLLIGGHSKRTFASCFRGSPPVENHCHMMKRRRRWWGEWWWWWWLWWWGWWRHWWWWWWWACTLSTAACLELITSPRWTSTSPLAFT